MDNQERFIKEIKVLSDSIRKKNRKLKIGISERDDLIESTFKPVIQPLKEISKKLDDVPLKDADLLMPVKKLKQELDMTENVPINAQTGEQAMKNTENDDENGGEGDEDFEDVDDEEDDDDENVKPMEESEITLLSKDIASHGKLYQKYVLKMLHGTLANRIHHVYGARLEKNGIMVGNKELFVDETDDINIAGKKYHGTVGLFELLFKKLPSKFTSQDLKYFKEIGLATNMHRKNYLPSGSFHRNTSKKYKNIISKLFPLKSGSGITFKNTKKPNVIYYNNINKLVERLKLLYEARLNGHTGLNNEIVSLIDELRQRGYIE